MPNINLVAARRDEKRQITTLSRQLFMGLVASGVILVATIIGVEGQKFSKRGEISRLDEKMATLQPKLDQIKKRESDIASMKPRVQTLDDARMSTLRWRAFMTTFSQATPSTVYITSMSSSGDIGAPVVALKGVAPSQAVVGDLAQRLYKNGTSMFSNVDISGTNNGSAPEDPVQKVNFDMTVSLKPVSMAGAVAADETTQTTSTTNPTSVAASAVKP